VGLTAWFWLILDGDLPITKRKKKKVGQKVISQKKPKKLASRGGTPEVTALSASSMEVDNSNLFHVGGNHMGPPDYSEPVECMDDSLNRLFPAPEWKLIEET